MAEAADPILASVLQRRVHAITQEMATVLMRSSRSPIFNEIGDLVTVVFDRRARTLAQTEYASIIANGAGPPLPYIRERFEGDLHDGDVILHNDVFTGGNQNADVGVYMPVWPDGVYRGESWMVSDGLDPTKRYRIAVEVTISGSEITFDFSETDDQAPGFTNMPPASATGAVRIAFLMLMNAGGIDMPTNEGLFAPVAAVFRAGSLRHPRSP